MAESTDKLWKEIWKEWSGSRSIQRGSWKFPELAKKHPELEDRIFRALTNENRFLVANCLVALEAMNSLKLNALPPELFERQDRIHLVCGSFGEQYTISWLAHDVAAKHKLKNRDFIFEDMPVGIFKDAENPKSPGLCSYEPFRGPGHYEMQTRLKRGERPRCYYDCEESRVEFTVRQCPEYGVLELSDFQMIPRPNV
jgi:hypothetical protein